MPTLTVYNHTGHIVYLGRETAKARKSENKILPNESNTYVWHATYTLMITETDKKFQFKKTAVNPGGVYHFGYRNGQLAIMTEDEWKSVLIGRQAVAQCAKSASQENEIDSDEVLPIKSVSNTLTNKTPYHISYVGVNNLKKDACILAGLIALNAIPFVGWIGRAARCKREAQLAMQLAEVMKFIILVITTKASALIVEDAIKGYIMRGELAPLQAGQYSNASFETVEMLIQTASLTDTVGNKTSMGMSVILEPGYSSYISNISNIHNIQENTTISWSSAEIATGISFVVELFDWIKRMIDAVNHERPSGRLTAQNVVNLTNAGEVKRVLTDFRRWVAIQKIPIPSTSSENFLDLTEQAPEDIVRFSLQCDAIVSQGRELISLERPAPYGEYNGLPITIMLPTERGETLPMISANSTELGGWNQSKQEYKKGGGLICFPVMVTPPTEENPNSFVTQRHNHYWQWQSFHIHAPATSNDGTRAFRYENLEKNRRYENGRDFNNTISEWGPYFTLVLEGENPVRGIKRNLAPAQRFLFLRVQNTQGITEDVTTGINDLESYVKQVQLYNLDKFNNPANLHEICIPTLTVYNHTDHIVYLGRETAKARKPENIIPPNCSNTYNWRATFTLMITKADGQFQFKKTAVNPDGVYHFGYRDRQLAIMTENEWMNAHRSPSRYSSARTMGKQGQFRAASTRQDNVDSSVKEENGSKCLVM